METKVNQTFAALLKTQDNSFCFECNEPANEWTSVNNGIFLCEKCASLHKKFGENISAVRSINNDNWSDLELAMMVNGGNLKLKNFFEKYFIPKDGPMDFKYRTKGSHHYRAILRALSEGKIVPDPIDANLALEIETDIASNADPNFDNSQNTSQKQEKGLEKVYSIVEKKFDQTVQKTKETASLINEKLKDPNFREDVKQGVLNMGSTLMQETKNVANIIGDKVSDPEFRQNVKEVGEKIATSAKKGVLEAIGFLKRFSKQDNRQPKFHIEEEHLDVVYSAEEYPSKSSDIKGKKDAENLHPNLL